MSGYRHQCWDFRGAVSEPSKVCVEEKKVLGHHLSKGVTALFRTAQATSSWSVKVLPSLEEDSAMHKLRPEIEHNIEQYLMRHMHGQALTMGNLPEDPPIVDGLKTVQIKKGDYRKGLVPKQDNAVHATHPLSAGSVLGVYRSMTMLPSEELHLRHHPPESYPKSTAHWRQAIDAYAAELAPPQQRTWGKVLLREVFEKTLQGQQLVCSGFGCSNMLACINDGQADPMSAEASKRDRAANVQLLPVAVCRWPFLFMITSEDVTPGELYLDYGKGFWEIQRDRLMEIEAWQRELDKMLQVLFSIPGDVAVTKEDVAAESACAQLASGRSEVVGLALWLIVQRCKGSSSPWKDFVDTLPQTTNSPTLWPPEEQSEYLQGSPALQEAQARSKALDAEWDSVSQQMAADPSQQADLKIDREIFRSAVAVVIAHAVYLPSVQCFSLLPVASTLQRTGADTGAALDYDIDNGCVTLTAQRTIRQGEPIAIYDGRPNTEMFLASGKLEENNLSDYLTVQASLVAADKLYVMKKQVVQSLGFDIQQEFPIYADRMPTQLLAFLRLSRLQDSGQMAKINFEDDVVISQSNEYEVLQLLMADMRDRLTAYPGSIEDEMKLLQNKKLTERQRAAAQLRFSEKVILQKTLDAVRRRLAPIRGIPTKGGKMVSPNADLEDIFSTIENIPNAPKKLFAGIKSWARGDKDPTWKR